MKPLRVLVCSLALAALLGGAAHAGESRTPVRPNAGFDLMKDLVGTWESKSEDGVVSIRYEIISEGTALMETMSYPGGKAAMVTIYHPDGDELLMTHYCGANNQPRMRCSKPAPDGKSLVFQFVDCSNLPTPGTGHMHGLVITLVDADHLKQAWTWMQDGKSTTETYQAERKKS
jgi:hypothetical protein